MLEALYNSHLPQNTQALQSHQGSASLEGGGCLNIIIPINIGATYQEPLAISKPAAAVLTS